MGALNDWWINLFGPDQGLKDALAVREAAEQATNDAINGLAEMFPLGTEVTYCWQAFIVVGHFAWHTNYPLQHSMPARRPAIVLRGCLRDGTPVRLELTDDELTAFLAGQEKLHATS